MRKESEASKAGKVCVLCSDNVRSQTCYPRLPFETHPILEFTYGVSSKFQDVVLPEIRDIPPPPRVLVVPLGQQGEQEHELPLRRGGVHQGPALFELGVQAPALCGREGSARQVAATRCICE